MIGTSTDSANRRICARVRTCGGPSGDLPWGPRRQRLFDVLMAVLPPIYRLVPRAVRRLPCAYYLWRLSSGRRLTDERDRADAA